MTVHSCTYCDGSLGAFKVDDGFEDVGAGTRVSIEIQMYRIWAECLECGAASRVRRASMVTAGKSITAAIADWNHLHRPVNDVEDPVEVESYEASI